MEIKIRSWMRVEKSIEIKRIESVKNKDDVENRKKI